MFGFIHESLRQLIIRQYGEDAWLEVLANADFEPGRENIVNNYYSDDETFRLVTSVHKYTKIPIPEIWEMYGAFLIEYTMEMGWDELLRTLGSNLKDFLDNLDSLHYFIDHTVFKHPQLKGPSFRCEKNSDGQLILHYVSNRQGLYPIVKGVIREVSKRVFNLNVTLTLTARNQQTIVMATGERIEEHVTFTVHCSGTENQMDAGYSTMSSTPTSSEEEERLQVTGYDFSSCFPYHIIFNRDAVIQHMGIGFSKFLHIGAMEKGDLRIHQLFQMNRPRIPMAFENIVNYINAVFVLQLRFVSGALASDDAVSNAGNMSSSGTQIGAFSPLVLKGQMILLEGGDHLLYMCSPYVVDLQDLLQRNMRLNSIPLFDVTRDLILLNQQRMKEIEVAKQLDETQEETKRLAIELEAEKRKAESLLSEVLPATVAKALMNNEPVPAQRFESATVLFSDVPNFANIVASIKPKQLVKLLNDLFSAFDRLVQLHDVYKVETVADSYMIVSGAPTERVDHAEAMCDVAIGMLWEANTVDDPHKGKKLKVRVGIHSGPIVTGVVGKKMPRYCLFGDTVNTASRMESHGKPGRIHVSDTAHEHAQTTGRFMFKMRGITFIKGKGLMQTYWLERSEKLSVWEIVEKPRDRALNTIDGYKELEERRSISVFADETRKSKACTIL